MIQGAGVNQRVGIWYVPIGLVPKTAQKNPLGDKPDFVNTVLML
jgi:hypothetical protein